MCYSWGTAQGLPFSQSGLRDLEQRSRCIPFFLEELLEALEQTLGMGRDREEPSGQQRDSEVQKQVMLVRQAIKIEASVVHKDEPYDLSRF